MTIVVFAPAAEAEISELLRLARCGDGNGIADFTIRIDGLHTLTSNDFIS